jgi:hypothetical protein
VHEGPPVHTERLQSDASDVHFEVVDQPQHGSCDFGSKVRRDEDDPRCVVDPRLIVLAATEQLEERFARIGVGDLVMPGVHLHDVGELRGGDICRVLDRLKVDGRARSVALELDDDEPSVADVDRHDAQDVEALVRAIKPVVFGSDDRELSAGQLGSRRDPRLQVLSLPQTKRGEGGGLDLRHALGVVVYLEQGHDD